MLVLLLYLRLQKVTATVHGKCLVKMGKTLSYLAQLYPQFQASTGVLEYVPLG